MGNEITRCPQCHSENPQDSRFCYKCGARIQPPEETPFSLTKTLDVPFRQLPIGSIFAGRYQLMEELGRGGMGVVFKAFDKEIGEQVALKLLSPEVAADEKTVERFRNELKFARKISHRHVCRTYHFGEEEKTRYITMEYVHGEDLKSTIRRVGQLSVAKAVSIAKQICEGLAEAHRLGVVHRDLKPQNIMIDREGSAHIMDFGIARSQKAKGITGEGVMIGTPHYMSPEQAEAVEVDNRSDIYSLGVILYEMVTGQVPFEGDTPLSVILKHKTQEPADPRKFNAQIPDDFNRLILKCMEKDKQKRYQSAEELLFELSKIEKEIPTAERIKVEEKRKRKWTKAQKTQIKWAAALVLAALVILGGFYLWRGFIQSKAKYEDFISFELAAEKPQEIERNIFEFLLLRSLTASTKLNIYAQEDLITYKRKTESAEEKPKKPLVMINAEVFPKVTGFEVFVSIKIKDKATRSEKFDCKGYYDFISDKIEKIHSFLSRESEGLIGKIEGDRTLSQVCTDSPDSLSHFLKGEDAWKRLDRDTALFEYKTAIEVDPEFSLARLKFAEVLLFRGDREDAGENLKIALEKKERLIEYDLLRLRALMARKNFKPNEERQYIRQLVEAFPFKKEYHYELAESYFQCGDADEAVKHYTQAIGLDPNYSLAHNHIAYCYSWMGNHTLAEEHFKKYIELDVTANSYDSLASGYMFAGRYDDAIKALERGKKINPKLDYLYTNLARNFILKGFLKEAVRNIEELKKVTTREREKVNAHFYLALIESMRGDLEKATQEIKPACDFYAADTYSNRPDESPNLPFWFAGCIAAQKGNLKTLQEVLSKMEKKIVHNEVNATNYFPVYKFYIHLRVLEGYLKGRVEEVLGNIEEGKRIKKKMGYRSSMFNQSYFYEEFAEVLMKMKKTDLALELLKEASEYNPNYTASHLNLAEIYLVNNDINEAKKEYQKAVELLSHADKDFILVNKLETMNKKILRQMTSESSR
jgi:serine/threonine protein kinase/Tfp pilus assembly protein PilF